MKQWKKFVANVSLCICTFAVAALFNVTGAGAAEVAGANLAVDYEAQQLTVTPASGDRQIYVAFPTVKDVKTKDKETGQVTVSKKVTVGTWDIYDGKAIVSLYNLNPLRENYVMVKGTVSEPVMIHFSASISGMRVTYDPINCKVSFMGKKNEDLDVDEGIQYRSPYGTWSTWSDASIWSPIVDYETLIESCMQQGATLYFREKPSLKSTGFEKETKTKKIDGYTTYEAGHFAGAEAKLKVAKRANGPKVTVDYDKYLLKIPLGTEYRFSGDDCWCPVPTGENSKGKTVVQPVELCGDDDGIYEVRYAAVEHYDGTGVLQRNKPSSKYTQIEYTPVEPIILNKDIADNVADTIVMDSTKTVKEVTFEYVKNAKTGKYTGLKITNFSDRAYDITPFDANASYDDSSKVFTVKAKNAKGDAGTLTLALPKYEGMNLYVEKKADAKAKKWRSNSADVGKIITPTAQ